MTFPNVIKTAPRHPNIALMYPIMIERGPAELFAIKNEVEEGRPNYF